ncbi:putative transposase [Sinobacterium caligoides]|uniref:Putative transposase n=1 Tax=Sinobacterium caligoides TaxID=933926 RepID=A0A3N2DK56_9GAMM|nr:transposase [Sinobacterium caligoides]ROS00052.1 putative transposase [Sinobacterium caligoides]
MARLPRLNLIDIPQHIVQAGHNNFPCFFCDDDYLFFLQSLRAASDQYSVDVHAYTLLPNMIQIIATPRVPNGVSSMMQSLGRRYVQYINHRYKRSGTLWSGRYRSSVIDSERFLLSCYRYVELRALHLGLVKELKDFKWSSFAHHSGAKRDSVIVDHSLYLALGRNRNERCNNYNDLFKQSFDVRLQEFIADTINIGQVLGSDAFKKEIEKISSTKIGPKKRGRPKKKLSEIN